MSYPPISRLLLLNKPVNWTSFDVVKKVRGIIKSCYSISKIKVGHSGTLDPKASGLLLICVGNKTKEISMLTDLKKKYIAIVKLGFITDSFDSETPEKDSKEYSHLSEVVVEETILSFMGRQDQTPPIFSAIKVNGERLYKKARRGDVEISIEARTIQIYNMRIINIDLPFVKFEVECSKGTYIRSLANDIGKKLETGAYLYSLKRTQIGDFKLQNAINIQDIEKHIL